MFGVAFRPIDINQHLIYLFFIVFVLALSLVLIYLIWLSVSIPTRQQRKENLRLLREFTENSTKITLWLKEHKEELQRHLIDTLNDQEFVALINRDQELYERVLEVYPDYSDTVMPPKELRQYFIELAQGQHKQTH